MARCLSVLRLCCIAYCAIANPGRFSGYGSNVWGFTACDGPGVPPFLPYTARGTPNPLNDDGTIAPAGPGGSLPFAPEYAVPALRTMYDQFQTKLWTVYGFREALNLQANWWGPHVLGIDQGPILLMAENYSYGRVWERFMKNPEVQRGLAAAGFLPEVKAKPTRRPRPAPRELNNPSSNVDTARILPTNPTRSDDAIIQPSPQNVSSNSEPP